MLTKRLLKRAPTSKSHLSGKHVQMPRTITFCKLKQQLQLSIPRAVRFKVNCQGFEHYHPSAKIRRKRISTVTCLQLLSQMITRTKTRFSSMPKQKGLPCLRVVEVGAKVCRTKKSGYQKLKNLQLCSNQRHSVMKARL